MGNRCTMVFLIYSSLLCSLFVITLGQQQLSVSNVERSALLDLRSSLGLRAKDWPIKSDPCASWAGIQCTNGRVTLINISGFRRTRKGSQSPQFSVDALQNLTLLGTFNASNFILPGSIPGLFGSQLGALHVLDLRSCSINGGIPSVLGNLSSLSELYLSGNNLTGTVPSSLGQISGLSVLDLSRNSLSGSIPGSFGGLRNLTSLDISGNFLTGMIPLEIGKLDKLRFLNLSRNNLSSSIPPQLGDLSNLVDLDLGFNSLSGSVPPDLRGLINLQRLIIGNNLLKSLPPNLFPSLSQLRSLALNGNNFDGNFPEVLWSLPSLEFVDVSGNNFTGFLPNSNPITGNATSSAAVFNISHNLLYGNITPVVRRFAAIDLSGNYFEGPVPDYARRNALLAENCLRSSPNQRSSAQCASFYANRGLTFDNFGVPSPTPPPPPRFKKKKSHKLAIILASVFGGLGLVILVLSIITLLIFCNRKNRNRNRGINVEPVVASGASPTHVDPLNFSALGESFTYKQILEATNEFDEANLIKRGHSGDLFRGTLEGPINVVIKRVNSKPAGEREPSYVSELEFFSRVSSPRFVPLVGQCLENENDKYLVYKHLKNGDLSGSLFKNAGSGDDLKSLDWITRLKIAIGAAEGLSYLHHECTPPIVHRDVQASSILLEDKFEVRLGSLSEICAQEGEAHQSRRITRLLHRPSLSYDQGSSGTPNATCAYDVYCFGKVLLELVTGKLGISSSSSTDPNTAKGWLEATLPYITVRDKELIHNIMDPTLLAGEDLLEEVWATALVAKSCLNPKPHRRPLMRHVLQAMENPFKVVREDHHGSGGSARLRASSSWNAAALFGSWRRSSSDAAVVKSGPVGSQGSSGRNGEGTGRSSSSKGRQSKEIFPEPLDVRDV